LTHAVLGMAMHFFVAQELVDQVSPELVAQPESIDVLAERLAGWASGAIDAEARRRQPLESSSDAPLYLLSLLLALPACSLLPRVGPDYQPRPGRPAGWHAPCPTAASSAPSPTGGANSTTPCCP
jgi:hypothetical protein